MVSAFASTVTGSVFINTSSIVLVVNKTNCSEPVSFSIFLLIFSSFTVLMILSGLANISLLDDLSRPVNSILFSIIGLGVVSSLTTFSNLITATLIKGSTAFISVSISSICFLFFLDLQEKHDIVDPLPFLAFFSFFLFIAGCSGVTIETTGSIFV